MKGKQTTTQSRVSADKNESSAFRKYTPLPVYSGETVQLKLDGSAYPSFEELWGKTRGEALEDPDWISERLKEDWDIEDFCSALDLEEHDFILRVSNIAQDQKSSSLTNGDLCHI